MTRLALLSFVTLLGVALQRADASSAARVSYHDQSPVVLQISDLRSAYLQRAGVVSYDGSDRTPAGLRRQLRRHFDVVLGLLDLGTADSVEIAVGRLEAADDHRWTAEERAAACNRLLAARLVQIQRLAAYRDRGTFPLNEGQSAQPAPIFVDRHDTACAVGHLMRCSGWTDAVDSIEQSNNLVYVPDATRSAIAAWVMTSGLTIEEAALIQPGYYWWMTTPTDVSAYEPGEAVFEMDGLRYSNFRLQAQNYFVQPTQPTNSGAKPTIAALGLAAGKGTLNPGNYPQHVPNGTHWISIGGTRANLQTPFHSLNASAAAGRGQMVIVSFDVAPVSADAWINGMSESSYWRWQGFQNLSLNDMPPASALYYLNTIASDGGTVLASLNIDQSTGGKFAERKSDTRSFAARQQISVESTLWLQNGVAMNTYVLDFNVVTVPEPASGFLGASLTAMYALKRRARIPDRDGVACSK